jgi:tRNA threonylcarbamoyl adenosine modification protein YjeE
MDLTSDDLHVLRKGDLNWQHEKIFNTNTPEETKEVAKVVFQLVQDPTQSLIFILQGDLGAGKTVFVQGLGELLGTENIISPTYVIYYEYEVKHKMYNKLYHFDLYQIKDREEFNYLDIPTKAKERSVLCLEWGEKSAEVFDVLRANGKIVYVTINYLAETEREIKVNF